MPSRTGTAATSGVSAGQRRRAARERGRQAGERPKAGEGRQSRSRWHTAAEQSLKPQAPPPSVDCQPAPCIVRPMAERTVGHPGSRSPASPRSSAGRTGRASLPSVRGVRVLVVEDERRAGRRDPGRPRGRGVRRRRRARRGRGAVAWPGERALRRHRPRPHAARHERVPGVRQPAGGGRLDADPRAHRQGRRVGRGRGARHRGRRLPDQAVLPRGAGRPAAGDDAPSPPRPARDAGGRRPAGRPGGAAGVPGGRAPSS